MHGLMDRSKFMIMMFIANNLLILYAGMSWGNEYWGIMLTV